MAGGGASCVLSALKPMPAPQDSRPSAALGAPGAAGSEGGADELITQGWNWPPGSVCWPQQPRAGGQSLLPHTGQSTEHLGYTCTTGPALSNPTSVLSQPLVR